MGGKLGLPEVLVILAIATTLGTFRRLNAGSVVAALAIVTFGTIWLVGHNSGHDAYRASHLVSVTVAPVAAGFGEATSAVVVETGESRPVPVSEMVCRPPPSSIALSAIATMAVSTPVLVVGVNSIPKTQL